MGEWDTFLYLSDLVLLDSDQEPIPHLNPEAAAKQTRLWALQSEYATTLSRLERLPVNEATRALVLRFTAGEVSIQQLDAAITQYLNSSK